MSIKPEAIKKEFEHLFEKLETERDEVIVKTHLASMEAKEELIEAERKWQTLKAKAAHIAAGSKEVTEAFIEQTKSEVKELQESYIRLGPYLSEKASFVQDELGVLYGKLKTERDGIIVKLHLASMEAKEEFVEAEKKWDLLKTKISDIADDTQETSEELIAKTTMITEELKESYARIIQRLSK
ncbi:hypothetical protein [Neptunomonas antarctica]|uniref:Uncharacterized protein n=1 Tax=Neptunomonas antarctica TaxID=619304 RepID=A0A1N7IYJ5_9GAMM|nr:hypothetical protein [Neptunomonas antarctica]SIS42114.1 hypothetical protein SAMN05421760_101330 [Neptunomonas antarctica]